MPTSEASLIVSDAELALFATASLDRNPLHVDDGYASRTAYGQRVSYGILAALACFGRLEARPGRTLAGVSLDFQRPVFPNVTYRLEVRDDNENEATLHLRDGTALLLRAKVRFLQGARETLVSGEAMAGRDEAIDLSEQDIAPGDPIRGRYSPERQALRDLSSRYGLDERGIPQLQIAALLLSSYVVGMEIPGKRALFSRLALDFDATAARRQPWLDYRGSVEEFDQRYGLVTLQLGADSGGSVARGELRAFVRPPSPTIQSAALAARLPIGQGLLGKTAVVIGGNRGLGGALSLGMALQGARVIASFRRGKDAAALLATEARRLTTDGEIIPRQLDAADAAALDTLRRELAGGIDILICSASPPLLGLPFDAAGVARINAFISTAVSLVSTPVAALGARLAARRGVAVAISSAAVREPLVEWPHYVAAKCAIEGLMRTAALAYKDVGFLIVRPPRLLTDMTNTPMGRLGALGVEWAAAIILQRLLSAPVANAVELLDVFPNVNAEGDEGTRWRVT